MTEVRKRLATQVKRLMEQQIINSWSDASDILEAHDPHRVCFEGEEDAAILTDNEDTDGDDDDVDDDESDNNDDFPPGRGLSTRRADGDGQNDEESDDCAGDDVIHGSSGLGGGGAQALRLQGLHPITAHGPPLQRLTTPFGAF